MSFDPSAYSLVSLPEMMTRLRTYLEASGLTCSRYIIDHTGNTASHLINDTFSLDVQTDNSGIYRDEAPIRFRHSATATIVWKMTPSEQFDSQLAAMAREEDVIRSVGLQGTTAEMRIAFERTGRTLSPARDFLISRIAFRVEHDWYGAPLETAASA